MVSKRPSLGKCRFEIDDMFRGMRRDLKLLIDSDHRKDFMRDLSVIDERQTNSRAILLHASVGV